MQALTRKLLRELWRLRGQMFSIAAVVAVGIMTVVTMRGTYESLVLSRDRYYAESRFPEIWVDLKRAPERLKARLEAIEGVDAVRTRVSFSATLDVPAVDAPALGQFVSVPAHREPMLAALHLTEGRYLAPNRRNEVIVSKKFAGANGYGPGDQLTALLNGRREQLDIVGVAISPEHIYAVPPGALYPDDARYGVVWMSREALSAVYDMSGAFNNVVLSVSSEADEPAVIAQLDDLLEPYGGLGAYLRKDQLSHQILQSELDSSRTTGTIVPTIFLLVAAFLLNIVLGRLIATQRGEIAVLKAFGYTNGAVARHYLGYALTAVIGGASVGIAVGIWLGHGMVAMYGDFFDFPGLSYRVSPTLILVSVIVSAIAAIVGALGAVRRAAALPPAEAMRAEPPASFRQGLFERLGLGKVLPPWLKMTLRNLERRPLRAGFSAIGVAFSVAILVVGLFMFDGVSHMMDLQFRLAQREDLGLTFNRPLPESAKYELGRLQGVSRAEIYRIVPAKLTSGHRKRDAAIMGLQDDSQLRRIISAEGHPRPLPPEGVVISAILADQLRVTEGDSLSVSVLEGSRPEAELTVAGVVDDFLGVSVYMNLEALHAVARGPRTLSGALLAVEAEQRSVLNSQLKQLPVVAGVASPAQMMASFDKQMAEGLFISVFFLLGFSSIISAAVIYNGARISLSERGHELASLRVFGFSRGEIARLLLGEQAIVTIFGIPIGCVLGYGLAALIAAGVQTETYRIPLIVSFSTFVWASSLTAASALLSGALVRRKLDQMSLVEVLKTRE